MASKKTIVFISGTINWAKVIGDPVPNFGGDAREWSFEIEPDDKGIETLKELGLVDRIKGKGYFIGQKGQYAERTPYIRLKKPEFMKDGTPNKPIRLYDEDDNAWGDAKIGNGSKGDVKLDVRDYGVGKIKGMYPAALRVTEHVEYEGGDFAGMGGGAAQDEDEAPAKKAKAKAKVNVMKDFGEDLDDEIPF